MNIKSYATADALKEYFKPKIDWKLYNFITDILTQYTDIGETAIISISIKTYGSTTMIEVFRSHFDGSDYITFDGYNTVNAEGWTSDCDSVEMKSVIEAYDYYGLCYTLTLDPNLFSEVYRELIDKIKRKFKYDIKLGDTSSLELRNTFDK